MTLLVYLIFINVATFGLYWADKRAARRQQGRVPEVVLIGAGFLGGTLAAFVAMRLLRHKTRKLRFQLGFWAATLIQLYFLLTQPLLLTRIFARLTS